MSLYLDYDAAVAHAYASRRPAVGAGFVAAAVERATSPPGRAAVLDAGCGTGAYASAALAVAARVVGLDASPSMLEVARTSVSGAAAGHLQLVRGNVQRLPFRPRSFDAVMLNQVLHHLEPGDDPSYAASAHALMEVARVLRPEGTLVLSACTQEQVRDGFWYYRLIPEAKENALRRCAPASLIDEMLVQAGFAVETRLIPHEPMLGQVHLDALGPLDADWRRSDSIWSLVSPAEAARAEETVRNLARSGDLVSFVAAADEGRRRHGQVTILVGRRTRPGPA